MELFLNKPSSTDISFVPMQFLVVLFVLHLVRSVKQLFVSMSLFHRHWTSWRMGLCVICCYFPSSYLIVSRWATISYWMDGWMPLLSCTLSYSDKLQAYLPEQQLFFFASQQVFFWIIHPSPNTWTPPTFISTVFFKTQLKGVASFIMLCICLYYNKFSTHVIVIISLNIYSFPTL